MSVKEIFKIIESTVKQTKEHALTAFAHKEPITLLTPHITASSGSSQHKKAQEMQEFVNKLVFTLLNAKESNRDAFEHTSISRALDDALKIYFRGILRLKEINVEKLQTLNGEHILSPSEIIDLHNSDLTKMI